jgi:hypothetical protein
MSKARWWVIAGAVGIVVLAAGLWLWQSAIRSPTPEEAARDYLHALESGDADTVVASGVVVSPTTLDAFEGATGLIDDGEVIRVRDGSDGVSAAAEVSFVLDGQTHTAQLTLGIVEGRWSVDATGLGTLTAESTIGSDVAIGDTIVPTGTAVSLLPATYTVAAAPTTMLEGESPVQVLPGAKAATAVDAAVRPEATAVAQAQLDEILEACTAAGTDVPDGCGIRIPWGTEFREVDGIRYRIDEPPVITLMPTGFTAEGGTLVATVTGTGQNGEALTTTYRTASWSLRGDVAFTADDLVLSPW